MFKPNCKKAFNKQESGESLHSKMITTMIINMEWQWKVENFLQVLFSKGNILHNFFSPLLYVIECFVLVIKMLSKEYNDGFERLLCWSNSSLACKSSGLIYCTTLTGQRGTCPNPSTWEIEPGMSWVQGYRGIWKNNKENVFTQDNFFLIKEDRSLFQASLCLAPFTLFSVALIIIIIEIALLIFCST